VASTLEGFEITFNARDGHRTAARDVILNSGILPAEYDSDRHVLHSHALYMHNAKNSLPVTTLCKVWDPWDSHAAACRHVSP
jgi:hypothetical protein